MWIVPLISKHLATSRNYSSSKYSVPLWILHSVLFNLIKYIHTLMLMFLEKIIRIMQTVFVQVASISWSGYYNTSLPHCKPGKILYDSNKKNKLKNIYK